jgi:hypothetical protein
MRSIYSLSLVLCIPAIANPLPADTTSLAQLLRPFRAHKVYELDQSDYKLIQDAFLTWIDTRMKSGVTVAQMNRELAAAGLLSNGPKTIDDQYDRTYAGFLGGIGTEPLQAAEDLLALKVGIYTGGACNFDETIVLYKREPLGKPVRINGAPAYEHGLLLRSLAVGKDDNARGRIIASAWVASNCTSNWNGSVFRIHVAHPQSLENVLDRDVDVFGEDKVGISIHGDIVRFNYTTRMPNGFTLRPGVATYRVQGNKVVRLAPIAEQFGGFIDEWLWMSDLEATPWSAPAAARMHHDLAARYRKELFDWERVAECPGSPPKREIAVHWSDSGLTSVFIISGAGASQLRMVSVSAERLPSCHEIDIGKDTSSITGLLPQ